MATVDLQGTTIGDVAIKAPCLVATTGAAITLSGTQVIDGVTVGNNSERVLVKDQIPGLGAATNGIYVANTGTWTRATDSDANGDFTFGTLVLVATGSANAGLLFEQLCQDSPNVIGTSLMQWQASGMQAGQSATSSSTVTIGTGALTFTTQAGKNFTAGQWMVITETSNTANAMLAQITSYSGTALVVNVTAAAGSGAHGDWTLSLLNAAATAGYLPPSGASTVTGLGASSAGHMAVYADSSGKVLVDGGTPGGLALIPCTAAGTNSITLTPISGSVVGYSDMSPVFAFTAANTSTGAVQIQVAALGLLNAYKYNGQKQLGAGDIVAGANYQVYRLASLNGGGGGFVVQLMPQLTSAIEYTINGGGVAITTGLKGWLQVPWNCTITQVTMLADQTGSIVVDVWRTTQANYAPGTHPVSGDSITASDKPTISAAAKSQDSTLTGWTTSLNAGDILAFNVNSASTVQNVTISLTVTR